MSMTLSPRQARDSQAILEACARGELSQPVALMRLLLLGPEPAALRRWLAERSRGQPAAARLRGLLDRRPEGASDTASVLRLATSCEVDDFDGCAHLFDRAVATNPQAAVAAYSLGDEVILAEATRELAALLERLGVLGPARHVLDIGCGIGRLEQALAPRVAAITGVDVSSGMIRAARERCAGLENVTLRQTGGGDLRPFADGSFDTVLAVDSFPYLFQIGGPALARTKVREAARVLRAGGDLVVLNLSYRDDLRGDRDDAMAMAAAAGFDLLRCGTADLSLWDGRTFHFRRAG